MILGLFAADLANFLCVILGQPVRQRCAFGPIDRDRIAALEIALYRHDPCGEQARPALQGIGAAPVDTHAACQCQLAAQPCLARGFGMNIAALARQEDRAAPALRRRVQRARDRSAMRAIDDAQRNAGPCGDLCCLNLGFHPARPHARTTRPALCHGMHPLVDILDPRLQDRLRVCRIAVIQPVHIG